MFSKLPSFLGRYYPFVFLALVLCGPVLLLPHTLTAFEVLATIDSVVTVTFAFVVALTHIGQRLLPDTYRQMFGALAAQIMGMSRLEWLRYYLTRLVAYASTTLLFLSAHPTFAAFGVIGHLTALALHRLLAKIHATKPQIDHA